MAIFFKVETDKIYIYPLGGISKFNMPLNIKVYKEFLILIMGPVFQNIGFVLLKYLINDYNLLLKYHLGILIFNLLPIYPLDGGKLINLLFTKVIPYRYSYRLTIIISYIMTIIILLSNNKISINMILTYIFLIYIIRKEDNKTNYIYNKFLLERLLNNYSFKKSKKIKNDKSFYREKHNIIKVGNMYINEKDYLFEKYKKRWKNIDIKKSFCYNSITDVQKSMNVMGH